MEAMREDSRSQSIGESWMMQSESIQRYWCPRREVRAIASRKSGEREATGTL